MKFNKIENQPKSATISPPLISPFLILTALSKEMLEKNKAVFKKTFDQNIDIK